MSNASDRMLRIATWNVMRPRVSSKRNPNIFKALRDIDADILVLTETNSCIHPGEQYAPFSTADLYGSFSKFGEPYRTGEKRVTIWGKNAENAFEHACVSQSGVCVHLSTPFGELNIYGTVIGPYGGGGTEFYADLKNQIEDWERLNSLGHLCILGDFNTAFKGRYFTKEGREKLNACFQKLNIKVPTRDIAENIDHIAVSKSFLDSFHYEIKLWNEIPNEQEFSDHMGVCLTLERQSPTSTAL
jgi:exonuclease III